MFKLLECGNSLETAVSQGGYFDLGVEVRITLFAYILLRIALEYLFFLVSYGILHRTDFVTI